MGSVNPRGFYEYDVNDTNIGPGLFNLLSASLNTKAGIESPIRKVANVGQRSAYLTEYIAAYGAVSASNPCIVWRANADEEARMEYTENGVEWLPLGAKSSRPIVGNFAMNSNQSISSGSQSTAGGFVLMAPDSSLDIQDYITLNSGDGAGVWTIVKPGLWNVEYRPKWSPSASGHRYIYVRVNNAQIDTDSAGPGNGAIYTMRWNQTMNLATGEDIRFRMMHNSGSALNLLGSGGRDATIASFTYLGEL